MNGITDSGGFTEPVHGVPPQSQIAWRVIEGASQRIVVCSMQSQTTGVEVRVGYGDNAVMRTQLALDADAARAVAYSWLQAASPLVASRPSSDHQRRFVWPVRPCLSGPSTNMSTCCSGSNPAIFRSAPSRPDEVTAWCSAK